MQTDLNNKKALLLTEVNQLTAIKKRLYSDIDIEQPMSKQEKELNSKIAKFYSEINQIIIEKRKQQQN